MHVAPGYDEHLPHDLAHFLVEREFGLKLGIFGQLAAGGDAGTFWTAPADRTARLAQRAHRLGVTGRGDLGRSERLVALCVACWEQQTGRRLAPLDGSWPLVDAAAISPAQLARVAERFVETAAAWHALLIGQSLLFDWPPGLVLCGTGGLGGAGAPRLRSA
jgi:hypothetical protein